jgi:hypothetical protein
MSSLLDLTVQGDVATITDETKLPQVKLMTPLQLYRLWERQNWWTASGSLAATVIVGYVLSRTTGLPSSTDDIGNWGEPLGIASLFVEASLVALATGVLAWLPQRQFVAMVPARQSAAHAASGEAVAA